MGKQNRRSRTAAARVGRQRWPAAGQQPRFRALSGNIRRPDPAVRRL